MSEFDDLMKQIPIDQIASSLGVDPRQVQEAARSAIPALVGGMKANAEDPAGARSLAGALTDHAGSDVSSVQSIDTDDGQKIVQNIFGGNTDSVISTLGGQGGGGSDLLGKLMPMLAPIVMSLIARQMAGGGGLGSILGGGSDQSSGGAGGGAPVGGTIGSGTGMAPGAPPAADASGGGIGGLNDMLGSILRGGSGGSSGGTGLEDLLGGALGGMLGGGKR